MSNDKSSIVGPASFNARVANNEPQPTLAAPRNEGKPAPTHAGYKTSHRDLTPSEAPVLQLPSASTISAGIAAALNRHDREQALVNGVSAQEFNARLLRSELAKAVAAGTMTEQAARTTWEVAFPGVDPASIGGSQS